MKTKIFYLLCFIFISVAAKAQSDISSVVNNSYYGVPTSPAFELLPEKPSEVTNVVTPKDFITFVPLTIDDGSLKGNVGFDIRPGAYLVGSLQDYRNSGWRRVLWRSVLSGGTSAIKDSKDVYVATGLRIPIIDQGDPRADAAYIKSLEAAITGLNDQPEFDAEGAEKFAQDIKTALDPIREQFITDNWNAFRLDVGLANMWRLHSARIEADSADQNRFGGWLAFSAPLCNRVQLMGSAKNAWINANADTLETGRASAGIRLRFFVKSWFAVSAEYARIWSTYKNETTLNEAWDHLAALVEIPIPKLKGVLGIVYGGDTAHRNGDGGKFELKYSVYTDKLINRQ